MLNPEIVVVVAFGAAITVTAGLAPSAVQCPTPCAATDKDVVEQANVVFGVIISVFGLKLAASKICPIA